MTDAAVIDAAVIDEFPIEQIPGTPLWSENYALIAADGRQRASIFYSIGRWYADPSIWRENLVMALPGARLLFARNYGRSDSTTGPSGAFSRFDVIVPAHRLRLRYAGPLWESTLERLLEEGMPEAPSGLGSLDLMFEGSTPVWNMRGDSAEASSMAGGLHIEQVGTAHGTFDFQNRKLAFEDCYSIRDHSRGVRDPSPFKKHAWINGDFPGRRSFFVYAMQLQGSDSIGMANAVIVESGEFHAAQVAHLEFIAGAGDARKLHSLVLDSKLGRMEVKVTEVLTSMPVSFVKPFDAFPGAARGRPSVIMFDEAVKFEWNGVHGLGWSERGVATEPL